MTNAEQIRQMTDEELVDLLESWEAGNIDYAMGLCEFCHDSGMTCRGCRLNWLRRESEEQEHEHIG